MCFAGRPAVFRVQMLDRRTSNVLCKVGKCSSARVPLRSMQAAIQFTRDKKVEVSLPNRIDRPHMPCPVGNFGPLHWLRAVYGEQIHIRDTHDRDVGHHCDLCDPRIMGASHIDTTSFVLLLVLSGCCEKNGDSSL